jgi:NitT/TauT family transport system substrate-binding protein
LWPWVPAFAGTSGEIDFNAVVNKIEGRKRAMSNLTRSLGTWGLALLATTMIVGDASAQNCPTMRKINVGVAVAPPNVVHTSPYVAKALGYFAKHCIDANIIQFEGGQSQTANVAVAQGSAIISVNDVLVGRGMKVQQIWGLAPRMPQVYMV